MTQYVRWIAGPLTCVQPVTSRGGGVQITLCPSLPVFPDLPNGCSSGCIWAPCFILASSNTRTPLLSLPLLLVVVVGNISLLTFVAALWSGRLSVGGCLGSVNVQGHQNHEPGSRPCQQCCPLQIQQLLQLEPSETCCCCGCWRKI